jgi:hypothetical protein
VSLLAGLIRLMLLQPSAVNPTEVAELCEPDVMGLDRKCQDASLDLIADIGIVIGEADPMSGLILDYREVDDFEQDRDTGINPDVHEHAKRMDGDDLAFHVAAPRQGRLKLFPFEEAEWVLGHDSAIEVM